MKVQGEEEIFTRQIDHSEGKEKYTSVIVMYGKLNLKIN